jgi:hypothetical protein
MKDSELITYGAVGLGLAFLAFWQKEAITAAASWAIDLTTRGQRLTETYLNVDASIPEEPQDLANAAAQVVGRPVDVDAYSAARMVRSEEGSLSPEVRALLVHVALNDARALGGWTLTHLMTYSTNSDVSGLYGHQATRRYSTALDPYEQDLGVAEQVIAQRAAGGDDPTGGATKFFNRGLTMGPLPQSWLAAGYQPETLDPAPDRLVFFRKA